MRKNSSDKASVLSSDYFAHFQPNSSAYNSLHTNATFLSPLGRHLANRDEPPARPRVKRNSRILGDGLAKPALNQEIKRAKEEL